MTIDLNWCLWIHKLCEFVKCDYIWWFSSLFFRYNDDCARGITTLAASAVPSLMKNISSLPTGLLNTLLTTLLETSKVHIFTFLCYLITTETLKINKLNISAIDPLMCVANFGTTLLSRPNKVGLKCPSVSPSIHKKFFDFNEIWCVGRGWWVMHNGMQYDPIQGQVQGHEPLKVGNSTIFKSYFLRYLQWELAIDHWFLN